ncbi:MAG: homing endonuclease associated repeat-containing protein [Halobacteriales archaeon]
MYTEDDCLDSIRMAARFIGKSPTVPEYRELGLRPSVKTIYKKFGSWPAAKRAAGLNAIEHGRNEAFLNQQAGYSVNEDYFETIDTAEKAYWLGFLYGDGYTFDSDDGRVFFGLELGVKDRHHLVKFKETIESKHPISPRLEGLGRQQ